MPLPSLGRAAILPDERETVPRFSFPWEATGGPGAWQFGAAFTFGDSQLRLHLRRDARQRCARQSLEGYRLAVRVYPFSIVHLPEFENRRAYARYQSWLNPSL